MNSKLLTASLFLCACPGLLALTPVSSNESASAAPNAYSSSSTSSSVIAEADLPAAPAQDAMTPATRGGDDGHGKVVGTFGIAGLYGRQFTQPLNSGQFGADGKTHTLTGWSATPSVNFGKHLGLQADFISMYDMTPANLPPVGVNNEFKLTMVAGPRYTFNPYWKATPFVFAEGGETRTSFGKTFDSPSSYTSHPRTDWNPTAVAGIGFDIKASRNIALQIVPGQWMGERTDWNGKWQHNYQARVGIVFYLRK